ncbi:MAG: hypothetical protein C5B53_00725 [Candidatus Melainabacteria bacterium]|nr:MAG: hypothetical protein C5B53_00725 [Candidatus Melainabacteria bacterium]
MPPFARPQQGTVERAQNSRSTEYTAPLSVERPKVGYTAKSADGQDAKASRIIWVPIPKWLAGKWVKQGDLTVSYTDLRTGVTTPVNQWTQNIQTTTWGNQIDGQGNVWHGYSIPTDFDGVSSGKSVRFTMVNGRRETTSPDHFVTRVHSIVSESYGDQIVDTFQQESLNDLFALSAGELENQSSTRDYTNEGQPIRQGMLVSRFIKVGTFEVIEAQGGVDLLKSLNDYLRANHMSQLVRTR